MLQAKVKVAQQDSSTAEMRRKQTTGKTQPSRFLDAQPKTEKSKWVFVVNGDAVEQQLGGALEANGAPSADFTAEDNSISFI